MLLITGSYRQRPCAGRPAFTYEAQSRSAAHNAMIGGMSADATFLVAVVLSCSVILYGLLKRAPVNQDELCWSCGGRNYHKLWCPNR